MVSLQTQYNNALKNYNDAQKILTELNTQLSTIMSDISKTQNEIGMIQAKLNKSRIASERVTLQTQLRNAQTTLTNLRTLQPSLQKSITIATLDVQNKKKVMEGFASQLGLSQVPVITLVPSAPIIPSAPVIPPQIFKRALLVGINYIGTQYELAGCINDVKNMKTQLQTFFPNLIDSNITLLTDETTVKPTKANILSNILTLVSSLKPGENVMFHYSGHGGRIIDKNGDEASGYDSCIYPINGTSLEMISDDELRSVLATNVPAGCKCFTVLDSCFSGTAVDLRYLWETTPTGGLTYTEDSHYSKTNGDVLFLSGAKDTQTAADTVDVNDKPCGALTWALLDTWRTYGPAIKTKYLLSDVRKFLKDRGYSQVPMLSTGKYIDLQTVFSLSD